MKQEPIISPPGIYIEKKENPTIKDVANVAGVSPATVGRMTGEYGYVGPETREKITAAIQQIGFKPNAIARSLKSKKTKTIGYLLPNITNLFYARITKGLQEVANAHGYNVILCNTDANAKLTSNLGRMLLENRVDGIVLSLPADASVANIVEDFKAKHIPIVVCHGASSILHVDRVMCDEVKGGFLAAKYLIDLGHRKMAIITVKNSTTSSLRLDGCRQAITKSDNDIVLDVIQGVNFSENDGYNGTKLLLLRDEKPTAIIASNDLMALGVLDAAYEAGMDVPNDISIIGFDNTFSLFTRPRMTTVSLPMHQAGQMAAQLLLERIEGRFKGQPRKMVLPEELVARGSTSFRKMSQ